MDSGNLQQRNFPTGTITLSTLSLNCIACSSTGMPGSAIWPTANRAMYIPFRLAEPYTVVFLWLFNGAAVAGNIDLGIYNSAAVRIVSTGATAQAGIGVVQSVAIAATYLVPGVYYMACAISSIVAQVQRVPLATAMVLRTLGITEEAAALPLPAVATFATAVATNVPIMGMSLRSVV